ncbi:hypothetical protein MNBD_GAMMA14-2483 [hydrothermal vent metagenome]|uniref:histidine kinase n=1 Tax=hydrothermal vent metagenome TaxID=652676 RepID=A0A3B0Y1U0_9ZZZZ
MNRTWSLRTKSRLAYLALALYALFLTTFVFYQKHELLLQFDQLQFASEMEARLRELEPTLAQAIEEQQTNLRTVSAGSGEKHIRNHLEYLREVYDHSISTQAGLRPEAIRLGTALDTAYANPSIETLEMLGERLKAVYARLGLLLERSETYRSDLINSYREKSDHVFSLALFLGLLGLGLLGIINGAFFSRLAHDLGNLEAATRRILKGDRSIKVPVVRHDEAGQLALAFNQLSEALHDQEKALEIERRKNFHQEKVAAIGTLAAGIAHEVGNPIAAIEALVRDIRWNAEASGCPYPSKKNCCKLEMVLDNTERLGKITREISGFARQQSTDRPELLDLNSLIRNTCSLMHFDARWKNIDLRLELDNNLPAIMGVSDQLTQVIMNLLVNAADAIEEINTRQPVITITTGILKEGVCIKIRDNGCGMGKPVMQHAEEAFFTTKKAGKGTGLGLSLCSSIVEAHKGQMGIDSAPDKGTVVKVCLPLQGIGEKS